MRRKILKSEFFNRNSVLVARDLIGKFLIRKIGNNKVKYKIVETEAYEGFKDKASHAHIGQTKRNWPMFESPTTIYVYFTYGIHWMLNISCGKKGHPGAVLIRGIEGYIGPARLTKKLKIDKNLNGKTLGNKSGLWIESDTHKSIQSLKEKNIILRTPRIGIDSSGEVWSKKLYRFVLQSSKQD